jgi:hypothetical protein
MFNGLDGLLIYSGNSQLSFLEGRKKSPFIQSYAGSRAGCRLKCRIHPFNRHVKGSMSSPFIRRDHGRCALLTFAARTRITSASECSQCILRATKLVLDRIESNLKLNSPDHAFGFKFWHRDFRLDFDKVQKYVRDVYHVRG